MILKFKRALEYFWYGLVTGLVSAFIQCIVYDVEFSWFRSALLVTLCSITIWLINKFINEVSSLMRGV